MIRTVSTVRCRTRFPDGCKLLLLPPVGVATRHRGRHTLDPAAPVVLVEFEREFDRGGEPRHVTARLLASLPEKPGRAG
jgi:hypothetical protein